MNAPLPLTDDEARRRLHEVQQQLAELRAANLDAERVTDDRLDAIAALVRQERDLTIYLTPERSGVPRVIRKAP